MICFICGKSFTYAPLRLVRPLVRDGVIGYCCASHPAVRWEFDQGQEEQDADESSKIERSAAKQAAGTKAGIPVGMQSGGVAPGVALVDLADESIGTKTKQEE